VDDVPEIIRRGGARRFIAVSLSSQGRWHAFRERRRCRLDSGRADAG
jgi:hypothetical protein